MTVTAARRLRSDAGFTLLDLLFVAGLIGLLSTLAIPGLVRARVATQTASALSTVRVVNSAQLSYAITCGVGFYAPDFPTLAMKPPLATSAFLPDDLAGGLTFVRSGYTFSMAGTPVAGSPASCNGLASGRAVAGYALVADQIDPPPVNGRFFGTNAEGVIYEHTASLASSMPETGRPPAGGPVQ